MKTRLSLLVALSLSFVSVAASSAADGWKMSSLNPFATKSGPPTSARVSDSPTAGWKMPSLWPKSKPATAAARRPAQPTAWQKMTSSTKKFWSTTADTINPFNDANDKPQQPISVTGTNTYFSQAANRKTTKAKSKSFLPSWGSGEAEVDASPKTVNGFLKQPMLQP